jgi:hypothetical protein
MKPLALGPVMFIQRRYSTRTIHTSKPISKTVVMGSSAAQ